MAGRLAEKVAGAADVAAQAAIGAVSAMSQTVKAATGSATGDHGNCGWHFLTVTLDTVQQLC